LVAKLGPDPRAWQILLARRKHNKLVPFLVQFRHPGGGVQGLSDSATRGQIIFENRRPIRSRPRVAPHPGLALRSTTRKVNPLRQFTQATARRKFAKGQAQFVIEAIIEAVYLTARRACHPALINRLRRNPLPRGGGLQI
jgi:hypothetical protein